MIHLVAVLIAITLAPAGRALFLIILLVFDNKNPHATIQPKIAGLTIISVSRGSGRNRIPPEIPRRARLHHPPSFLQKPRSHLFQAGCQGY
jgi:hypothetical protein